MMKNCDPLAISETLTTRIKKGAFLTVKAGDSMNTMTVGWGLVGFIWQRSVFMVAVRDSRHTFSIMEKASDFTVTFPTKDMQDTLMFCGSKSGRDLDKFKACKLIPVAAQQTLSPVLQVPGIHLECRICFKAPMDPAYLDGALHDLYPAKDYHTLYFGEIVACYETDTP
ncbi:MAG: flavin reductase family protein [Desulfomonilia bacterium]|jgi:flavin reductase (DIM6/NTAB) family NADH-FMN oxidoreductase RutF